MANAENLKNFTKEEKLLLKARQYAMDVERYCRIESSQGHLSPTDLALMSRLVMFLRYEISDKVFNDMEYLIDVDLSSINLD